MSSDSDANNGGGATPITKRIDHEGNTTLPDGGLRIHPQDDSNLLKKEEKNRPVMWAEPTPQGVGPRSGGPGAAGAGTVTGGPHAQHAGTPGAGRATAAPAAPAKPGLPRGSSAQAGIVIDAGAAGAGTVTGGPHAQHAGAPGAGRATAAPAAPAKSGLPARTLARGTVIDEGATGAGAVTGGPHAQHAGTPGAGRATAAPAAPTKSGLPPRTTATGTVIDEGAAGAGAVTGGPHAQHAGTPGAGRATAVPAAPAKPGVVPRREPKGNAIDVEAANARMAVAQPQTEQDRAAQVKVVLQRLALPQRLALAAPVDEARAQAVASRAKVDREGAFAIVAAARDRVRRSDAERKERQDTEAGPESISDYTKKYAQVDAELQSHAGGLEEGLRFFFDRHAPKKQTFQAYQSALRARTIARVRDLLKAQDKLQREKASPELWSGTVWLLAWALRDLEAVDGIERSECLERTGQETAGSNSKRRLLYKLDPEWRNRFLRVDQRSSTYRMAGAYSGDRDRQFRPQRDRGFRSIVTAVTA